MYGGKEGPREGLFAFPPPFDTHRVQASRADGGFGDNVYLEQIGSELGGTKAYRVCLYTDMSKKSKERLGDPALGDHPTCIVDFFDI